MSISFSADQRACTVVGPEGQKIRILFSEPTHGRWGKTRLRLHEAGPMHLKEAFLGGAQKNVIVTLVPEGWTPTPGDEPDQDEGTSRGVANSMAGSRGGKTKDPGVLRTEFRALIPEWLAQNGPMTTDQLYDFATLERPDLCSDAPCECREAGDKVWQHQLRWAQQDLKNDNKVFLEGNLWKVS